LYDFDRILALSRAGLSPMEIALRSGAPISTVYTVRSTMRNEGETFPGKHPCRPGRRMAGEDMDGCDDASGARCRCGLRLPCNNCLPAAAMQLVRPER
jgi:hypothetical protein